MYKKNIVIGIVIWSILLIVLPYLLIGSFNPIQIFYSNVSMLAKILIAVMLLFFALALIQLLVLYSSIGEQICPICNKKLMDYVPVYGKPKTCWTCLHSGRKTQYHEKCYKAALKCPVCENENPWSHI
jgi:hypothetical protein